ncbi:MAG: CDP-alcohol phosphatidyltransferase family protein [Segniliparus sp.]|uniref:CDP-alcohol phosphatidyltransferase family protein n=1 Tax=Segniliparus sp. TaxID=2804064 RepID=UPI003F3C7A7A
MLSSLVKPAVSKVIAPLGGALVRCGVTPNVVTVVGTLGTVASALVFFPTGHLILGAVVCGAFAVFDMLDGAVARASGGGTRFGAVLDASCDRIADGAIFGALAYWAAFPLGAAKMGRAADSYFTATRQKYVYIPNSAVSSEGTQLSPEGFQLLFVGLLVCLVSALTISYIKARAEASGLNGDGGWIERPERLVIILVGALLTGLGVWQALPLAVAFLALTSVITVGQRILSVWRGSKQPDGPQ